MILNLLRVEALKVEEMIKRSFSENASQRRLPEQQNEVDKVCATLLDPNPILIKICPECEETVFTFRARLFDLRHRHKGLL